MDQAQKLRELTELIEAHGDDETVVGDAKVVTISSGKGGVGKTNFTVNLAIALAKMGKRVSIIDADLGLANVDVLFGIVPKYNISHAIKGEVDIKECLSKAPHDINILSSGSGIIDMVDMAPVQLEKLIKSFGFLNQISDYILIDTGAGLSKSVLSFIDAASDVILIITPDPTSITDAYALIKNIDKEDDFKIKLIINRVESNEEGEEVFHKLQQAVQKFLSKDVENFGYIYEDENLRKAIRKQVPMLELYPRTLASKCIEHIAYNYDNNCKFKAETGRFKTFLSRLIAKL
ncbi:MinD/ParA family protein [Fusibacter sp. JL298sf-3]